MENSEDRASALKLAPADNVAVALRALRAGEWVTLDGASFAVDRAIAIGHKLAARAIAKGDAIVKYNCPIGDRDAATSPPARTCTRTT